MGSESQKLGSPSSLLIFISSLSGPPTYKYLRSLLLGVVGSQCNLLPSGTGFLQNNVTFHFYLPDNAVLKWLLLFVKSNLSSYVPAHAFAYSTICEDI